MNQRFFCNWVLVLGSVLVVSADAAVAECGAGVKRQIKTIAENQLRPLLEKTTKEREIRGLGPCMCTQEIYKNIYNGIPTDLKKCLEKKPPSCRYFFETSNSMFSTNYDWHSSVAAHWALFSINRVFKALAYQHSTERVVREGWSKEVNWLKNWLLGSESRLMYPVGIGWFALLSSELRLLDHSGTSWIKPLLSRLSRDELPFPEFPGAQPPDEKILGNHYSWLYMYFLTKNAADFSADETWKNEINEIWKNKFQGSFRGSIGSLYQELKARSKHLDDFTHPNSIFWANQALVNQEYTDLALTREWVQTDGDLHDGHPVGEYLSRLLPLALRANATSDETKCQAVVRAVEKPLAQQMVMLKPSIVDWEDTYIKTGHWIPQMIWLVLWTLLGRP